MLEDSELQSTLQEYMETSLLSREAYSHGIQIPDGFTKDTMVLLESAINEDIIARSAAIAETKKPESAALYSLQQRVNKTIANSTAMEVLRSVKDKLKPGYMGAMAYFKSANSGEAKAKYVMNSKESI